ncbi:hypothetical protein Lfu02_33720 [Longispora fulva]|nr:hypothetical protein Lfu02_33720 [Longispora fulva]
MTGRARRVRGGSGREDTGLPGPAGVRARAATGRWERAGLPPSRAGPGTRRHRNMMVIWLLIPAVEIPDTRGGSGRGVRADP